MEGRFSKQKIKVYSIVTVSRREILLGFNLLFKRSGRLIKEESCGMFVIIKRAIISLS